MGDRGHVTIDAEYFETEIVFYTHWQATDLPELLGQALGKRARWNDPEYLARIIFDQISEAAGPGTTGAGIGTSIHGDAWRVLKVDVDDRMVHFAEDEGYHADKHGGERYTFEEFIEEFCPDKAVVEMQGR